MRQIDIYDAPLEQGADYIVKISIRNGPLLRAMRVRGFKNVAAFSRACGFTAPTSIHRYFTLTKAPISKTGKWSSAVLKMAEILRMPPESLFPVEHLTKALARSTGEFEASLEDIKAFAAPEMTSIEDLRARESAFDKVTELLKTLSPREQKILEHRYGLNGEEPKSLDETGAAVISAIGGPTSRERVRQIEAKALRRLQHPSRAPLLREWAEEHAVCQWAPKGWRYVRTHMPPVADLEEPEEKGKSALDNSAANP